MSTSDIDKYKVDNLFLLIGENPLPNYVAAKTLLTEGGKPYLVFSEKTEKPAERLQEELDLGANEMVPLDNNASNAYEIRTRIQNKVQEIQANFPQKKRFGLNYTGGTKAMAVHAYQALLYPDADKTEIRLNPPPVFSYLDSHRLKMLIDQKINPIPFDIRKEQLELTLEKLFKLHGFSLSKPPKTDATFPELVKAIFDNHSEWQKWCSRILRLEAKKKTEIAELKTANNEVERIVEIGGWKSATDLRILELLINELPENIVSVLKDKKLVTANIFLSLKQIEESGIVPKPKKTNEYPEEICKWLEGVWLEDYVLQQLQQIQSDCSIDEIGMSFDFPKSVNIAEFEFDVAFLRGYQLFAISCTTDTKPGLCKFKLFEAYRRARQMGGDEARIALVCCADDPDKIRRDFSAQVNDTKINVFRYTDPKFSENLRTWIKEVDK